MGWAKEDMDTFRGGYGLRSYFNAGLNRETLMCDEEGTDFYDADTLDYVGSVCGVSPMDIEEMTEEEFYKLLEENDIC